MVLFEGWEGSGCKSALRNFAGAWDPCFFSAHCVRSDGFEQSDRHWLAPYWTALPVAGRTTLFYRSWYRRLVERRVEGLADKDWYRAFDEINEFEAQQAEHGTLLVKLFFHISSDVQRQRRRERQEHDWERWLLRGDELGALPDRDQYVKCWEQAFELSDTRWAPWTVVDAGDTKAASVAAQTAIADAFAEAMPAEPPQENVVALQKERWG